MGNQPKIPIKKADGTVIKVSMPEFLEYQKTGVLSGQADMSSQPTQQGQQVPQVSQNTQPEQLPKPTQQTTLEQSSEIEQRDGATYDFFADSVDDTKSNPVKNDEDAISRDESQNEALKTSVKETKSDTQGAGYDFFADSVSDTIENPVENSDDAIPRGGPQIEIKQDDTPYDFFSEEGKPAQSHEHQWDKEDHASPVEDAISQEDLIDKETTQALPHDRGDLVAKVLEVSHVELDKSLYERVRSLIQSRAKGIRNDEQLITYATTEIDKGGLGLTQDDATALDASIKEALKLQEITIPKKSVNTPNLAKEKPVPKQKTRTHTPQPTTLTGKKPMMHDITPAQATNTMQPRQVGQGFETIGPVDELARFSQTDLNRLGKDKSRVMTILKNKFDVLKEESFVLYLDAVRGWLQSPLYQQYKDTIVYALNNKKTLNQVIQEGKTTLTMDDIDIIIEINKIAK